MPNKSAAAGLKIRGIRGYSDRPSAAPGETISFYVSSNQTGEIQADLVRLIHGDTNPQGPGLKEEVIPNDLNKKYQVGRQKTQIGNFIEIADKEGKLAASSFSVQMFVQPGVTLPSKQALMSRWSEAEKAGWALFIEGGILTFAIGDGKDSPIVLKAAKPIVAKTWYSISAVFDHQLGLMTLSQKSVCNSANGQYGLISQFDTDSTVTQAVAIRPKIVDTSLIIAGLREGAEVGGRARVTACLNGKIDAPSYFDRPVTNDEFARLANGHRFEVAGLVGAWDFAAGIGRHGIGTDHVADVSGNDLRGWCVNQPERACTGWNWNGNQDNFILCPEQYGAIAFHEDALDDCRWEKTLKLTVPETLKSDCYAIRLVGHGSIEHIPFFVLPPRGRATAEILLLFPTFSYLAYANWQPVPSTAKRPGPSGRAYVLNDFDVEVNVNFEDYGLSCYEYHRDSRSVKYSSWRRPISNMRPMSRHREFGGPWAFPADLHLLDWLNEKGFKYDVATDHDLAREGSDLLKRYKVVLTGTHPEYYTVGMLDAWEQYLLQGGRGMYLGGNGFYWVVSTHPEKPWVMEIRKGESGATAVHSTPGEFYHSTSGERGGLWRHRGRPPQKIFGTGFVAYGWDCSSHYVQLSDAREPEVSWIVEGINLHEKIGDFGLIGKGAAGMEIDAYDPGLGSPPNSYLLASSTNHTKNYVLATEVASVLRPGMNGQEHPEVRADIVYLTTQGGGAMFSPSSIAWCASLSWNDYDNNVSRMTENVLRAFVT